MGLLFAAIGATITALGEATIGPYIKFGDAIPHLTLVGGVVWAIAAGIERGITWAFVGGLVLDSLLARPLGASAFALLVGVGGASLIALPFPRLRLVASVVAVPLLSIVYSVVLSTLNASAQPSVASTGPVGLFIPGALYDTILGMFLGPLAVTLHDRTSATERMDW